MHTPLLTPDPNAIVRNLVHAAHALYERKMWKRFSNIDCVGVRVAARGQAMLAVIMGKGGGEHGLTLFRGEAAGVAMNDLFGPEEPGDDAVIDSDILGFSMDPFASLPPDGQELLRGAGIFPRHDQLVPRIMSKPPGHQPRLPGEGDLELLLWVTRGILEADQKKLLKPATLEDECGICILSLEGTVAEPVVSVTRAPWPREEETGCVPGEKVDLSGVPQYEMTWLAGLLPSPMGVENDDRMPRLLLVTEEGEGLILRAQMIMPDELDLAAKKMIELFRGKGPGAEAGLPTEMLFSSRKLLAAMKGILEPRVSCRYEPDLPGLRKIAAEMFDEMDAAPELHNGKGKVDRDAPVPEADDLKGWKAVDRELGELMVGCLMKEPGLSAGRAVKQYFGDDDLKRFLQEHHQRGVVPAYAGWALLHYRVGKPGRTQAEKLLKRGLSGAQAALLRARMESYPSIYRIAGHDAKAGTVEMEDVLLGGKVTIYDRVMSENIEDGLFMAARAFAAGRFHFFEPAGPPLGSGMGMDAVEFLQEAGMEFTPEGLRRDAHKFGWLWDWSVMWQDRFRSMRVANMDGDALLWHTASFSVADMAATRKALQGNKEIHEDEEDTFVWTKESGKAAKMMGGSVNMGRIELVGDELIVEVNSARRLAKARKWIEKLPGVVFRDMVTRGVKEAEGDRPMDERMPEEPMEITAEMAADIQQMITKQYMDWLDLKLPVLKGLSPRQACKTEAGRQQVLLLIRTIPDPMGPVAVRVPREEMLKALGLDGGDGTRGG